MAQNGQTAQITPILWSSYYPNLEPILVSQPCLGELVLRLRDRNSRPLSGSQTTSFSSSTWRRCPRPNGCHFYKYVFNRFLSVFTCMLCTNWMAEQSPSFCTSQLGNGFNLGNLGFNRGALGLALLPGNSTIARLSGCWLPYHLDDKYKKFLFAIFIFGEEWIYM